MGELPLLAHVPFIDSSFLVLLSCFAFLRSQKGFNDDALVRAAQEAGEKLYFAGMLDNYEAVTKDSLKTAVGTFLQMGVLSALPVENVGTVLQVKLTHDELFRDLHGSIPFETFLMTTT